MFTPNARAQGTCRHLIGFLLWWTGRIDYWRTKESKRCFGYPCVYASTCSSTCERRYLFWHAPVHGFIYRSSSRPDHVMSGRRTCRGKITIFTSFWDQQPKSYDAFKKKIQACFDFYVNLYHNESCLALSY